jgi:uncharacterized protein involved in outer membrane biogenesis/uncharacterized protein YggL (DUF469 family)
MYICAQIIYKKMAKNNKKILKITLSVIFFLLLVLLVAPFVFKGKIKDAVINELNKTLTAKIELGDIGLSFIRHFPNASITLENLNVIGENQFAADTLLSAKTINAVVNIKSFFTDRYEIKRVLLDKVNLNAHILPDGKANWDIFAPDSTKKESDTTALKLNLKLEDVRLKNANIIFNDEQSDMKISVNNLNFSTSGDFTADSSLLKTTLKIEALTCAMSKINYLSNAEIDIQADINANLNAMRFELQKNSTKINAIELALIGWLQILDEGMDMDLSINSEKIDFKSILSLIPAIYKNSFKDLKADGKLQFTAAAKGKMVGENYPAFNIKLVVENGQIQYPQLPKSLKNINLNLQVENKTEKLDNTVIDLAKLSFDMGGNVFQAKAHIENPLNDLFINAFAKGIIDLGMVKDFYPLDKDMNLNGIFNIDLNLAGKMSYYEKNQFDKFTFGGNMSIKNLFLKTSDLKRDLSISTAKMQFSNKVVDLSQFEAKIGKNDLSANGKLENFLAYIFNNQTLKGQLNLNSNYLNLNDFMSDNSEKNSEKTEAKEAVVTKEETSSVIEIPKNLNFGLQAQFKELIYEKMNFTNAHGTLKVENGIVTFRNLGLNGFGGSLNLNGEYNSENVKKPAANISLDLANVAFTQVFSQVETMQKIAPIFENLIGNFSTKINLNTELKEDMTPNLATLYADGTLSTQSVGIKDIPALTNLTQNLQKIPTLKIPNLSNTTLKNLNIAFKIKDGKIDTKPFDINAGDVKIKLGGSSGLDKTLAWKGTATLPDKANLGRFQNVGFEIGGTFQKPTVKIDLKEIFGAVVDDLKQQATQKVDDAKEKANAEIQKQREKALQEAQKQVDLLKAQAKEAGNKLVQEAETQAKKLVDAAKNPVAKIAAETAGKKAVEEAQKKAAALNAEADKKGKEIMQKAADTNVKI